MAFFFVVHDFYIYWFHRLQHRSAILWRIHEAHHATPEVDWLSGSRSHALEILINQTVEFAPIFLLGFGLLAAWWVALPFWAATKDGLGRARLATGAGVVLLAYLATFSALGYWR